MWKKWNLYILGCSCPDWQGIIPEQVAVSPISKYPRLSTTKESWSWPLLSDGNMAFSLQTLWIQYCKQLGFVLFVRMVNNTKLPKLHISLLSCSSFMKNLSGKVKLVLNGHIFLFKLISEVLYTLMSFAIWKIITKHCNTLPNAYVRNQYWHS